MYCAGCGSQVNPELNYCNSCGTQVIDQNNDLRRTIAKNFSIVVGLIGTFGLIGFVILIKSFLENGSSDRLMIFIAFLYLSAFVALCYFLINNILSALGSSKPDYKTVEDPAQLSMPTANRLEAHQEPAQSVVENTTRTLDENLVERN
jgi:hypothetical protein